MTLAISADLTLPDDAVTETFAILAKRGKGKTYTAAVMVEEMIAAGLPVVVIDPVGVWWGLRSSADGKAEGLPVVIFGGDHADVPLEQTAGTLIADVIIDQRAAAVIDLARLSKRASKRFMADFLERLYHRNRDALHVVIDEADEFAPQRAAAEGARLLGAMEDLVRRGRARGIGVSLITQRPAVLNKDVLTQAEVLVVLGMTGPRDVAAIDEWVRLHADEDQAREVKASLPSLPVGTAWVWSPGWLNILQRVEIRKRATFDSSATPKAGERRLAPKRMAAVDIAALGEQIAATVEKARADDPRELRARIAELERSLAKERSAPPPEPVIQTVSAITDADRTQLFMALRDLEAAREPVDRLAAALERLAGPPPKEGGQARVAATQDRGSAPVPSASPAGARVAPAPPAPERPAAGVRETRPAPAAGAPQLKAGARHILETLARHHPMRVTRAQLGTLAKFKITGGTFQTYWSTLKRHGLVDESGGDIGITQEGLAYVGVTVGAPLTTEELLEQWRSALKAGARSMLDHLVAAYPDGMTRSELAESIAMTASGGTFQTYLSTLRRNGLVDVDAGVITASRSLFLGAAS